MLGSGLVDIYCDESCHLENDGHDLMVLGAIAMPHESVAAFATQVRDLKSQHGLSTGFEAKWTKVSPGQLAFYVALVDAFLDAPDVRFRGLVARNKSHLRHHDFEQDHDTWYYKMYWEMLRFVISPSARHRIYLDIKDTRGGAKTRKLGQVLASTFRDSDVIEIIQIVRSHEVQALQVADLILGAVGYKSRGLTSSAAKNAVARHLEDRAGIRLDLTTPLARTKVNIFHWTPQVSP